jgi:hypothetical protein
LQTTYNPLLCNSPIFFNFVPETLKLHTAVTIDHRSGGERSKPPISDFFQNQKRKFIGPLDADSIILGSIW